VLLVLAVTTFISVIGIRLLAPYTEYFSTGKVLIVMGVITFISVIGIR
jgi:hypothetical protein